MFRLLFRNTFNLYNKTLPRTTQVFHTLTNKQLATPQLTRALVRKRIPFHSRVSQVSLFHGKRVRHAVKSCFSQKKSNRFKRVHKVIRTFHSAVLNKNIRLTMSMKAFRCVRKMQNIDNYLLCTKPKDLDSKYGEYLRTIMLRKINDPEYRLPYILGSNRRMRIKKYYRYLANKAQQVFVVPKQFKKNMQTFQRKFGSSVDQLTNQDYKKYLQLQKLKKATGNQVQPTHPLVIQLNQKLQRRLTAQQQAKMQQMSEQFKQQYLNNPKNNKQRRQKYEKNQKEYELLQIRIKQAFIKYQSTGGQKEK